MTTTTSPTHLGSTDLGSTDLGSTDLGARPLLIGRDLPAAEAALAVTRRELRLCVLDVAISPTVRLTPVVRAACVALALRGEGMEHAHGVLALGSALWLHTGRVPEDARPTNAGPESTGSENAGLTNAGPENTGPTNAGCENTGLTNAGPENAGLEDAGLEDAELGRLELWAARGRLVTGGRVLIRQCALPDAEVQAFGSPGSDPLRVTTPARTGADLARRLDLPRALACLDALAAATGLGPGDVLTSLAGQRGARGLVAARRAVLAWR